MKMSTETFHSYTNIAGNLAGGKFVKVGESSMIRQTKTIQISIYN